MKEKGITHTIDAIMAIIVIITMLTLIVTSITQQITHLKHETNKAELQKQALLLDEEDITCNNTATGKVIITKYKIEGGKPCLITKASSLP